jgi:3-hydroxyisobutyrate dehydrogenase-like beta-hydroxyacid dehydrogenase
MKVAFIGLGHMGTPMSRNILAAGHDLVVHDRGARQHAADAGRRRHCRDPHRRPGVTVRAVLG